MLRAIRLSFLVVGQSGYSDYQLPQSIELAELRSTRTPSMVPDAEALIISYQVHVFCYACDSW